MSIEMDFKLEVDPETLIMAVKKHPALYNKNDPNFFNHKKYKAKLWLEVCREVFPNYDNLRPQNKVEHCHELQKRWKSLRTCFTRERTMQKKEQIQREREGRVKKRKRYEYYDMMSYLLITENEEDAAADRTVQESDDSDDSGDPLENIMKNETIILQNHSANIGHNSHFEVDTDTSVLRPVYETRNENLEDKILDMLKEIKKDEEDEDRQFMLSLVPSFRKLDAKQKFEARIEILRVLKDVTFKEST